MNEYAILIDHVHMHFGQTVHMHALRLWVVSSYQLASLCRRSASLIARNFHSSLSGGNAVDFEGMVYGEGTSKKDRTRNFLAREFWVEIRFRTPASQLWRSTDRHYTCGLVLWLLSYGFSVSVLCASALRREAQGRIPFRQMEISVWRSRRSQETFIFVIKATRTSGLTHPHISSTRSHWVRPVRRPRLGPLVTSHRELSNHTLFASIEACMECSGEKVG
jgi:hypothetical protein